MYHSTAETLECQNYAMHSVAMYHAHFSYLYLECDSHVAINSYYVAVDLNFHHALLL